MKGNKVCTSDEHWVLYVSAESLNSTPEMSIKLYVDQLECKSKHLKNIEFYEYNLKMPKHEKEI